MPVVNFLAEFWAFVKNRKKFWLIPLLVILGILVAMVVMLESSAVMPFIYTLF